MSVTGRDSHIIADALATALVALEQLPEDRRPEGNIEDMRALLGHLQPGYTSVLLAQAECRLLAPADPMQVYRKYGLTDDDGPQCG